MVEERALSEFVEPASHLSPLGIDGAEQAGPRDLERQEPADEWNHEQRRWLFEQPANRVRRHLMAYRDQCICEVAGRLRCPAQRTHRIAPRRGLNQRVQIGQQIWVSIDQPPTASTRRGRSSNSGNTVENTFANPASVTSITAACNPHP